MRVVSTHKCTFTMEEIMGFLAREIESQGYTPVPGATPQESRVNGQVVWVIDAISATEDSRQEVARPAPAGNGLRGRDENGVRLKKDGTPWPTSRGLPRALRDRKAVANPTVDPLSEPY